MAESIDIPPARRPVSGTVRPPGSKSLTNRALIVAALADGASRLNGILDSEDTQVMIESLRRLGLSVAHDAATNTMELSGCGGMVPVASADLWLENSGTSIRFLTALCALGRGRYRLDGNPRMRERPIAPLIDALRGWRAAVVSELGTGCPPVVVEARGLPGATIEVAGDLSSQYLSALLMAAPCAAGPVEIRLQGPLVSRPYVDMTLAVMRSFSADCLETTPGTFRLLNRGYRGTTYGVEPDASAASYFFAAAAVTVGRVTVSGLGRDALQGDVAFVDVLERMGCEVERRTDAITVCGGRLRGIDVDMNAISDTAQTLAAVAPFADGPTTIRNVAHIRHKETDRIKALVTELRRLGLNVQEHPDGLTIHPGPMHAATIETYNDHRMAMSFAVLGLRQPGVRIANPGCTAKTYPRFFEDLQRLCGAAA
jgi:3-phosphoshikimate 1-carboxyvinyltransferase